LTGTVLFFFAAESSAFTTEELIGLKKAGVSEDIIVFMVENGYKDAAKVIKLKEAGFKDETIVAVIKSELKESKGETKDKRTESQAGEGRAAAAEDTASVLTTAKIKILWYMIYRGNPVIQNFEAISNVKTSVESDTVTFEWKENSGLGLLEVFRKKPFKSPFLWTLNKDDSFENGQEGYAYALRSTVNHKGKPDTDGAHFWVILMEPADTKIAEAIRSVLRTLQPRH